MSTTSKYKENPEENLEIEKSETLDGGVGGNGTQSGAFAGNIQNQVIGLTTAELSQRLAQIDITPETPCVLDDEAYHNICSLIYQYPDEVIGMYRALTGTIMSPEFKEEYRQDFYNMLGWNARILTILFSQSPGIGAKIGAMSPANTRFMMLMDLASYVWPAKSDDPPEQISPEVLVNFVQNNIETPAYFSERGDIDISDRIRNLHQTCLDTVFSNILENPKVQNLKDQEIKKFLYKVNTALLSIIIQLYTTELEKYHERHRQEILSSTDSIDTEEIERFIQYERNDPNYWMHFQTYLHQLDNHIQEILTQNLSEQYIKIINDLFR